MGERNGELGRARKDPWGFSKIREGWKSSRGGGEHVDFALHWLASLAMALSIREALRESNSLEFSFRFNVIVLRRLLRKCRMWTLRAQGMFDEEVVD